MLPTVRAVAQCRRSGRTRMSSLTDNMGHEDRAPRPSGPDPLVGRSDETQRSSMNRRLRRWPLGVRGLQSVSGVPPFG